ncbi:maleylpyruvate isomerase N-terminal domain-containing protein [Streptomyces sp. NPDC060028]|uniref:maleylpyruvate isomerase N-terminal domain-containing protein n=1 Tax=Streptomyces sp. NPDC060028 TaxID=3347041 RepID=UPI003676EE53
MSRSGSRPADPRGRPVDCENRLEFPDLLRLIDERSTAFRAAVAAPASLDVRVPTRPEWTLFDLVRHLGDGRRSWAAGPPPSPQGLPPRPSPYRRAPRPRPGSARPCWPG